MLRKLLVAGIVFAIGYITGVIFGFRSAVVDYIENDAESIEDVAQNLYPSPEEGARTIPDEVGAVMEEVKNEETTGETTNDGSKGYQ